MTMRLVGIFALLGLVSQSFAAAPDPKPRDYFWAQTIQLPAEVNSKVFDFEDGGQGNITFTEGLKDVAYENGRLSFTLEGETGTIGWGNYRGRQPLEEIISLFPEMNRVLVQAEQDGGPATQWRMYYWADGKRLEMRRAPHHTDATLEPNGEQTLEFDREVILPAPDGLEFIITGEPGTHIVIEQLEVQQTEHEGYVRTEFELPEGEIWRATAEVAGQPVQRWFRADRILNELFINGENVERVGALQYDQTRPVDLKPYLKPGQANAIGLYGYRIPSSPVLFAQATIIMTSGEVIRVGTDDSWRYSADAPEGWAMADFEAEDWKPVATNGLPGIHSQAPDGTLLIPVHEGYIRFANPNAERLAYNSDETVSFEVVVPAGLADQNPQLRWWFAGSDATGQPVPISDGSVSDYSEQDDSLVYRFEVGQHEQGVYTIAADLLGEDGQAIEQRPREPVLVVGKLHQEPIKNNDWYGSLDTELELEIDFTDESTDRPWIAAHPGKTRADAAIEETEFEIIEVNGKQYRQTKPLRGAFFSYRIEGFEHPGDFYLMEMTYPDDKRRHIEVNISTKRDNVWTNAQTGVGAETGGKFYLTGEEQTLRWIHVADPGVHSVDVINVEDGLPAAAGVLRVYHIKGDLPSAEPGTDRLYGVFTERTSGASGVGAGFGANQVQEQPRDSSPIARTIRNLKTNLDIAQRYTQYLKFIGQNAHIMGIYQYYEYNTPYVRPYEVETARLTPSLEGVLAETFDANDIAFYAGVELSQFSDLATAVNNAQVARGEDTYWMVDAEGRQLYGNALFTIVPNWLHQSYQDRLEDFMADITSKYAHLDHFKGLHFYTSVAQRWEYYPPGFTNRDEFDNPFLLSYDDVTFEQFQQHTGIELGIDSDSPDRFARRAEAVQQPEVKQKFVEWRTQQFHELLKVALQGVRRHGENLQLVGMLPLEEPEFNRMWVESGRELKDLLKDYGYDLDLINSTDGLRLGTDVISWRETLPNFASQDPYVWLPKTDPRIHEAFDVEDDPRYVMVRNSWDENIATTGGETIEGFSWQGRLIRDGWIFNALKVRTQPQPSGYSAREAFAQAILAYDPTLLTGAFLDLVPNVGFEQELGSMLDAFTHLPKEKFQPVLETGLDTNLAIRRLEKDGQTWFYIINPGYWHIDATVTFTGADSISNVGPNDPDVEQTPTDSGLQAKLQLTPFGLRAFVLPSTGVQVQEYVTGQITERELAHMTTITDRVHELLQDQKVRVALPQEDREFLEQQLDEVAAALEEQQYAAAWHRITNYRFWSLWQDFLETAAQGMALLPEQYETQKAPATPERTLTAREVEEPVQVDGQLNENVWQQGTWSAGFVAPEGTQAMAQIGVKAAYDDQNVYLAFVAADLDTAALKAEAESAGEVFGVVDDAIVMFLQPAEGEAMYYQLAFNPAGTQFHQQVIGGARDYSVIEGWDVQTAVQDEVWTAEVVLPRSVFNLPEDPEAPIKVNFHRIVREDLVPRVSWSRSVQWHDTSEFGTLELED